MKLVALVASAFMALAQSGTAMPSAACTACAGKAATALECTNEEYIQAVSTSIKDASASPDPAKYVPSDEVLDGVCPCVNIQKACYVESCDPNNAADATLLAALEETGRVCNRPVSSACKACRSDREFAARAECAPFIAGRCERELTDDQTLDACCPCYDSTYQCLLNNCNETMSGDRNYIAHFKEDVHFCDGHRTAPCRGCDEEMFPFGGRPSLIPECGKLPLDGGLLEGFLEGPFKKKDGTDVEPTSEQRADLCSCILASRPCHVEKCKGDVLGDILARARLDYAAATCYAAEPARPSCAPGQLADLGKGACIDVCPAPGGGTGRRLEEDDCTSVKGSDGCPGSAISGAHANIAGVGAVLVALIQ